MTFEEAYPNKNEVEVDGMLVSFMGLEDLKTNKRASGREKDLEDLRNLQRKDKTEE
ncbi:MAG: hypothetical protein AAF927_18360 [Bacteroidota bacterium]